jgi:large conductance mechanosensitive channel
VAVIVGTAFTAIVAAFTKGLITPLVGMIFANDLSQMTFTVNGSTFNYGIVIDAVIYFVSVAAVVFFVIVKPVQAVSARRSAGEEPAAEPTDEVVLLTEIRDLLQQSTG